MRTAYIAERNEPGVSTGRVVTLDERIIIDDYLPDEPTVLWSCDVCDGRFPVTAQFPLSRDVEGPSHITVCAGCLRNALNGIDYSLANPTTIDGAALASPAPPRAPTETRND